MAEPTEPARAADADRSESETGRVPFAGTRGTGSDGGGPKDTPWPRLARMDDQPPRDISASVPVGARGNRSQIFVWLVAQVCGIGLLLGGYFLGQAWAPRPPVPAPAAKDTPRAEPPLPTLRTTSAETFSAINQALQAERRHDFAGARAFYREVSLGKPAIPGAQYRLALLALHEGEMVRAEEYLNQSIRSGDDLPDCYLFLASLAGAKNDYSKAAADLASAVHAAPFDAKLLFCWGEALRRAGRLPEAIQRLTEALDRPDTTAARELYLFKLSLAKIEVGREGGLDAELADPLTRPAPTGGWLVLAAARDLLGGDDRAAAAHLEQAKRNLPPETFATYLQDFLFQSRHDRPGLSAILTVPPPTAAATEDAPLQDPSAWSPAEADPAVWPPFPKAP